MTDADLVEALDYIGFGAKITKKQSRKVADDGES